MRIGVKNTLFDRVQIVEQIGLVVYPHKADICKQGVSIQEFKFAWRHVSGKAKK